MDWYRMKTVLIFLFLAINLFLGALLGYESFAEHKSAKERTEGTVTVLQNGGVSVSAQVPTSARRLRALTLENPYADKAAFASRLLGEGATASGDGYEKDGESVRFMDKGFVYQSTATALTADKKHIAAMKKALESMGFSMRYAKGSLEDGTVVFTQIIDKVPLFGCRLSVSPASDGSVAKMEGTWANVQDVNGEKKQVSIAAQALLAFLQEGTHEGETVKRIECGYAVLLSPGGYRTADAVPAWRIETENGTVAFFDARQ